MSPSVGWIFFIVLKSRPSVMNLDDVDHRQPLAASEWSLLHVDELGTKCTISERGGRFVISEIVEPYGYVLIYQEFLHGVINAYILAESN